MTSPHGRLQRYVDIDTCSSSRELNDTRIARIFKNFHTYVFCKYTDIVSVMCNCVFYNWRCLRSILWSFNDLFLPCKIFSDHANKFDCTTSEYVKTNTLIWVGSSIQYISIMLVSNAGITIYVVPKDKVFCKLSIQNNKCIKRRNVRKGAATSN